MNKTVVKLILFFFLAISALYAYHADSAKSSLLKKTSNALVLEESLNDVEENDYSSSGFTLNKLFTRNETSQPKKTKQEVLLEPKSRSTFQEKFYSLKTAPPFKLL